MKPWFISCYLIFSLCASALANASTDGRDYTICKRLAVKYLESCLRDQTDADADSCWSESRRVYQTCREDAIDQGHSGAADIRSGAATTTRQPASSSNTLPRQHDQEKINEVRKIRGIM